MSPAYRVRGARASDLAFLPRIEHAATQLFLRSPYPAISHEPTSSVAEFAAWLERGSLSVAVAGPDEPVGFAIAFELDGGCHLHEIDVDPAHGRSGAGRSLVEFVASRGRLEGLGHITLSTFRAVAWNEPFYRALGFRELAPADASPGLRALRVAEHANGLPVDARLFMVRDIGGGRQ